MGHFGQKGYPRLNQESTVNDLLVIWIEEWGQITQQQVDRLIASIRRRCIECIEAAGGHTVLLMRLFKANLMLLSCKNCYFLRSWIQKFTEVNKILITSYV